MPRKPENCVVVLDGTMYKTTRREVSDYLTRRLSGIAHARALLALGSPSVHASLFTLPANAPPERIAECLRLVIGLETPEPTPPEKGGK